MLTLRVRRKKQSKEATLGQLTIDGISKSWFVLEPGGPDSIKEGSDKRIVAATYSINRYSSPKYPNSYEVMSVPGRSYILFHKGNYHEETEGCFMPGKTWGMKGDNYYVGNSKTATGEVFKILERRENIRVVITNDFSE
ncbi:DUF5675 family protein [Vibrio maritimus]